MKSAHKGFALKKLKGFTLIELLIVIAIIGVLAVVVLVAINPAEKLRQARDSGRKNDIGQISTSLEAYYTAHTPASYPYVAGACNITAGLTAIISSGDLRKIPDDQKTGWHYCYNVSNDSQTASLYATLEANKEATDLGATVGTPVYFCWRSPAGQASAVTALGTQCLAQ